MPPNVRHPEWSEAESKDLLRSEKELRRRSFGTRLSPRLRMTQSLGYLRGSAAVQHRGVAGGCGHPPLRGHRKDHRRVFPNWALGIYLPVRWVFRREIRAVNLSQPNMAA